MTVKQIKARINKLNKEATKLNDMLKGMIPDEYDIMELPIGVRAYWCLKRAGVNTVGDLIKVTETELYELPNCGRTTVGRIKEALSEFGFKLKK